LLGLLGGAGKNVAGLALQLAGDPALGLAARGGDGASGNLHVHHDVVGLVGVGPVAAGLDLATWGWLGSGANMVIR